MKTKSPLILPLFVTFLLLLVMFMSSCAKTEPVEPCMFGHTYGFFGGLLHGIIAPFGLVGMIFWEDVEMYAPNNNGIWYALGFLLGSGGWGLLATKKKKVVVVKG